MVKSVEQKLMDDDPLQFIMWLMGYKLRNHFYVLRTVIIIVVTYLQTFNVICIKDIILYKNFTYLEYLPGVFLQQTGCFGLLVMFTYIKDIVQYQDELFGTFWSMSSCGGKTKRKILRESKIITLISILIYGLSVLAHFVCFFPLVGDETRLIFPVMYCTKHFGEWSRGVLLIFYLCILLISYGAVWSLFVTIYVIFHAKFQFYLLNVAVRKIPKEDLIGQNHLNWKLMHQSAIYGMLSVCAKHHVVIKTVTTTLLRKVQNVPMLIFSISGVLSFVSASCFLIFRLSPSSNWKMVLVLAASISITLMFCISGQELINESNQFFVTLYNTPWYHWNKRSKMALGMMLMNSMEPMTVSCFGLAELNYEFILMMARTIYSLLAVSSKFK